MYTKLKIPLKELLTCACSGDYTNRHVQELYRLIYTIAFRLVRRKVTSTNFSIELFGLSDADITHDCIAELFVLGNSNELKEIRKYFNFQHILIEDQKDEVLFIHIRRLVFTVVNDNIFRLYNEADPSLGKILRNIKLALGRQPSFSLVTRFGEYYLELKKHDPLNNCRTISDDEIKRELYEIMANESDIPGILQKLAVMLTYQETYRRELKLISLACAIRDGYRHHKTSILRSDLAIEPSMADDSAEQIIKATSDELKAEMMPRYVQKNKVGIETFLLYIRVVEQALRSEFIAGTDGEISYFEHLRGLNPDITREEYHKKHRVIIEYFGKISKSRVREKLKEIL
jgi:hypothetical protein